MSLRRSTVALASAFAAACLAPAATAATCGEREYTHTGVQAQQRAHGIAAELTIAAAADVRAGHVAAWVNVGFADGGPGGTKQWLQIGVNATPGTSSFRLYYEFARVGRVEYHELDPAVPVGTTLRLAVLEIARRPNWWRVWLDGSPASPPIFLPESHRAWEPTAAAESWTKTAGSCNRYAFRFSDLRVATRPGGGWRALAQIYAMRDQRYKLAHSARAFTASARGFLPREQPARSHVRWAPRAADRVVGASRHVPAKDPAPFQPLGVG